MDEDEADHDGPGIRLYPLVSWEVASLSDEGVLMRSRLPARRSDAASHRRACAFARGIALRRNDLD